MPEKRKTQGPPLVVVADDLTGAADTGVQFLEIFGHMTLIHHERVDTLAEERSRHTPVAVYTNSRHLPPHDASMITGRVAGALERTPPGRVYKKVDSCLRGNIGAEVEALMEGLGYEVSFIAPAFPDMGRTTVDGIHRVHGIEVSETELARDPVTPVTDSHIGRLLSKQCREPVSHVQLDVLRSSEEFLLDQLERMRRSGARHMVFDSEHPADLERIAQAALQVPWRVLPVGSAGLAKASVRKWITNGLNGSCKGLHAVQRGPKLWVIGTASAVTFEQVERLLKAIGCGRLSVHAHVLAEAQGYSKRRALAHKLRECLLIGDVVLGISKRGGQQTPASQLPRDPHAVVRGLAEVACRAIMGAPISGVFLCGGDTASAFLECLGCEGLSLQGEALSGVPCGRTIGGDLPGLPLFTKAGAFGEEDTLIRLHEIWEGLMG
jgi:uncharacterized protein YgbK (DUF1537 family)